jgi:uncharacterized protein YbaR (Trm112 family)
MPEDVDHLDDAQIRQLHHILFEVEVVAGELVSETGRRFPIIMGIPDMCPNVPSTPQEDETIKSE